MQSRPPDVPDDPWMAAICCGHLEAAWAINDAILKRRIASRQICWTWPRHLQFVWNGDAPAGKRVFVRCYHGLGDTIQFIRFIRQLRAVARHVAVWAQPALLDLLATAAGIDQVLALHDGKPDVEYDVDIEIMEVPHALRVSSIPNDVPYLTCPHPVRQRQQDGPLRVGLAWKGGEWDGRRNVPLHLLKRLADVSGVRLFSLQRDFREDVRVALAATECDTIGKTAARMLELDLVVSVDTMVAHLAGALGLPIWTLLHAHCDWRWGRSGPKTVWYPTMRLFRQSSPGDWSNTIDSVCAALAVHSPAVSKLYG
jgi:hypothetical protein